MNYSVQGKNTSELQGLCITHDHHHQGLISIHTEGNKVSDFSIHTTSEQTTISGNVLVLDFKLIKIKDMYQVDEYPREIYINQKGYIVYRSMTPPWLHFTIGVVLTAALLYLI